MAPAQQSLTLGLGSASIHREDRAGATMATLAADYEFIGRRSAITGVVDVQHRDAGRSAGRADASVVIFTEPFARSVFLFSVGATAFSRSTEVPATSVLLTYRQRRQGWRRGGDYGITDGARCCLG
jgi:hypothetical protein